jgi:hypothetical protein
LVSYFIKCLKIGSNQILVEIVSKKLTKNRIVGFNGNLASLLLNNVFPSVNKLKTVKAARAIKTVFDIVSTLSIKSPGSLDYLNK